MNEQRRGTVGCPGNEHELPGREKLFRQGEMVGECVGVGGGRKALEQIDHECGSETEDDRPFPGAEFFERDVFQGLLRRRVKENNAEGIDQKKQKKRQRGLQ